MSTKVQYFNSIYVSTKVDKQTCSPNINTLLELDRKVINWDCMQHMIFYTHIQPTNWYGGIDRKLELYSTYKHLKPVILTMNNVSEFPTKHSNLIGYSLMKNWILKISDVNQNQIWCGKSNWYIFKAKNSTTTLNFWHRIHTIDFT